MGKEALCLAEALEAEREWEADGIVVLRATASLPQMAAAGGRRAKRFNRYYRRFCRAYFAYCEQELLPRAAERCRAAMERSAPWEVTRASLGYAVTYEGRGLLSLQFDAREDSPRYVIRRADTWDLSEGLPVPVGEFFPTHCRVRRRLVRFAREEARRRIEEGAAVYRESCRVLLRRALNPRNYCLCEEGLRFFYPMCSVADAAEGIVSFTLPYDEENGPFLPPEA